MTPVPVDWDRVEKHFDPEVVAYLRGELRSGGESIFTVRFVAAATQRPTNAVERALSELERLGALRRRLAYACPCERRERLSESQAQGELCPHCDAAYVDRGSGKPKSEVEFVGLTPVTRDPRWVLLLHGMNTRGAWQQEFSWLIAQEYGYAVPVYIYKYGLVRLHAILRPLQRLLCTQLARTLVVRRAVMQQRGFGERPDIVAHSFGTWLIACALQSDPSLRVGRLILLGSVVRPDFNWRELIDRGQVEAVLCHYGTKDFPVACTHYCIPDSGPSGRRGFNDREHIRHVQATGFGHSDYFLENHLQTMISNHWGPFLTASSEDETSPSERDERVKRWRPTPWPIRASVLPWMLAVLAVAGLVLLLAALLLGLRSLIMLIAST